jgi:hypothetical protein
LKSIWRIKRLLFRFKDSSDALAWFIEYVLPFVNCTTEIDKQNAFFSIWQRNSDLEEFGDDEKHYKGANEFHRFIKRLMLVAFAFENTKSVDSELEIPDTPPLDLEARLKEFLMPADLWVRWNEKMCFVGFSPQVRMPEKYIEQLIVHSIAQCFYIMPPVFIFASAFADNHLPPKSDYIKGPGFEKVGLCPNCGIFFAKSRKDQEYCSKRCNTAASVRRLRERKKNM